MQWRRPGGARQADLKVRLSDRVCGSWRLDGARRAGLKVGLCAVLLVVAGCAGSADPAGAAAARAPRDVVVSAASSLATVMEPLAVRFEERTGTHVALNIGPSNTLARQIAAGARVDVFISADEAQMDLVADRIVPGSRSDLLSNQLVVAVPAGRAPSNGRADPARMPPLRGARDLLAPDVERIAIGDPGAVPAGVYAREYLRSAGLWDQLQLKLVPTGSVRLALEAVDSGAVDAAIVYRTDLAAARHVQLAFAIPQDDAPPIRYPAALMATGRSPVSARAFLDDLRGPDAASVFMRAGFIVLPVPDNARPRVPGHLAEDP